MEVLKLIKSGLILGLIFAPIALVADIISYRNNSYPLFSLDNITVVMMSAIIAILIALLVQVKKIERKKKARDE